MRSKTQWNLFGILSTTALCVFAVTAFGHLLGIEGGNLEPKPLVSCIMDIGGILVCIILFLTTFLDYRINRATSYFLTLILFEGIILYLDFIFWLIDGEDDLVLANEISNYLLLGFVAAIVGLFWLYLREHLDIINDSVVKLQKAAFAALIIGMLVILTNPLSGLIFEVGSDGVYDRGTLYAATYAGPLIALVLELYAVYRYTIGFRKKIALCSYAVLPIIASVIQAFFFGIGLIYISILFSIVLIYGNLYVERGQALVKKQAEITEHNITMLTAQIQPEFLYKSLESIARLEGTPDETKKAIREFSRYMEVNMHSFSEKEPIDFEKELEHVRTYVALEKLRFKEKLAVCFELNDTDFAIPALTLQMLVENAIKHGITAKEGGGTITVKSAETDTEHIIIIVDDGLGFDPEAPHADDGRSHIGLTNIRQRLTDMVDGTLTLNSAIGKGTTAIVTIPKTPQRCEQNENISSR